MGTITALTRQKRNPNRISVYLDGSFAFGVEELVAARLRVGQTLSVAETAALQQQDQVEKARQSALRYISYRPRSVAEVRKNLQGKGFEEAVIEEVVQRLEAAALLDDAAFARYWVEQRETFKPRSQMALRAELQKKGVSRAAIETAVQGVDETAAAWEAAQKKAARWTNLPEEAFRRRLGGFLQRRGFSYELIQHVTDEMWKSISVGD